MLLQRQINWSEAAVIIAIVFFLVLFMCIGATVICQLFVGEWPWSR